MTAKEKFEARLNQLGLADEWSAIGGNGKVATFGNDGSIILLIHEGREDGYSEIRYPSYKDLRENEAFVDACAHKCVAFDNDLDFTTRTARWLLHVTDECPLVAEDIYSICEDEFNEYYNDFEDDSETLPDAYKGFKITIEREWANPVDGPSFCGYRGFVRRFSDGLGKNSGGCIYKTRDEAIEEAWDEIDELTSNRSYAVEYGFSPAYGPLCRDGSGWKKCWNADELRAYLGDAYDIVHDADKWWLVGRFTDGDLWMNNEDGCCYLNSTEAADIYYARFF